MDSGGLGSRVLASAQTLPWAHAMGSTDSGLHVQGHVENDPRDTCEWGTDAPKMERLSWSTGRGRQTERTGNRQEDGQAGEPTGMVEGQTGEADGKGTGEEDG